MIDNQDLNDTKKIYTTSKWDERYENNVEKWIANVNDVANDGLENWGNKLERSS